jgi:uncharacterized repeat protein (TIGR01451 family)
MGGWKRGRVGGVIACVAVVAAAWAVFALVAPAQTGEEPGKMPFIPSIPVSPVTPESGDRGFPRLQVPDEDVQPAQFTTPGGAAPGATTPARTVPDPPSPVVRIQVRVPADSPPGDEIKYLITVQNVSSADAHRVTVRNPLPDTVAEPGKADPEWDKAKSVQKDNVWKELVWSFGTLKPGATKTIELNLKPKKDAGEVKNLAYVSFEHGEAVTTRINKPAVKVTKSAPKQAVRDEPYAVRVLVENTGKVPAENVRVVENVPASAEVEPVTKGAKRTDRRDAPPGTEGQQWVWEIAKLMPGERRVFEYRVTAREAKDLFALTNLSAAKGIQDKAEARTLVLVPGLTVKLTGPAANAPVNPGESAKYEITVRNAGTLPSTNVRVTGTLPADCKPTMKTEGGLLTRDAIQWTVPRLEPGEAQTFRFAVKASTTGRRVVVASVADARGQRAADELATLFQGTAALVWESVPNPAALAVGRQGTFTVKVRNNGGEAARNVRVEIELPEAVSLVQVTPNVRPLGTKLPFGPEVVPAYGEVVYTVSFEAKQSAQAWFKLKMTADSLGDRPMQTEKAVEITGGR